MKILYDNLIKSSSLTATNEDDSFPVANLYDRFLEKRFQATGSASTISIEFAMDQAVSCIALGFHNLSSASYNLKDSGGTSLRTGSLEIAYDTNMTYFTETSCRVVEITLASASTLYLGGLSVGSPLSIEYWNVNPRLDYYTKDKGAFTLGGQFTSTRSTPLKRYRVALGDITESKLEEIQDMMDTVGNWDTIYSDVYDEAHSNVRRPIYSRLNINGQFVRDSYARDYSLGALVMEECR